MHALQFGEFEKCLRSAVLLQSLEAGELKTWLNAGAGTMHLFIGSCAALFGLEPPRGLMLGWIEAHRNLNEGGACFASATGYGDAAECERSASELIAGLRDARGGLMRTVREAVREGTAETIAGPSGSYEENGRARHGRLIACAETGERGTGGVLLLVIDGSRAVVGEGETGGGPLRQIAGCAVRMAKRNMERTLVGPTLHRAGLLDEMSERDIAHELHRSQHTVHDHVKSIYAAWGVRSRFEMRAMWSFPGLFKAASNGTVELKAGAEQPFGPLHSTI